MNTILAYLPVATAVVGLSPDGRTCCRQWAMVLFDSSSTVLTSAQMASVYATLRPLLANAASSFLRDVCVKAPTDSNAAAAGAASVTQLASVLVAGLASLQESATKLIQDAQASATSTTLKAELGAITARAGIVEMPTLTTTLELGQLLARTDKASIYELLCTLTSRLMAPAAPAASGQGALGVSGAPAGGVQQPVNLYLETTPLSQLQLPPDITLPPAPLRDPASPATWEPPAESTWSNGRLFLCSSTDATTAVIQPGDVLAHDLTVGAMETAQSTVRLATEMLRWRTDPVLQMSGAALAAAGVPLEVILHLSEGTGRARTQDLPPAPFGLPDPSLGAQTALKASLDAAVIHVTSSNDAIARLRATVTRHVDGVLIAAQALTVRQLRNSKKAALDAATKQMKSEQALALAFRDRLAEEVAFARAHEDHVSLVALEPCLRFLSSECAAGTNVIHVQSVILTENPSPAAAGVTAVTTFYARAMQLMNQLYWARYGFPLTKLDFAFAGVSPTFRDVFELMKARNAQITNPGQPEYKQALQFRLDNAKNALTELLPSVKLATSISVSKETADSGGIAVNVVSKGKLGVSSIKQPMSSKSGSAAVKGG